jgi:predicted MPP superfamily phosphohydrolase
LGGVHAHRPKNLLRIPLAPGGNMRLAGHTRPGGVQGGRLAE